MKPDFNYNTVPYQFAHCLNDQCPRAGECLRHLIVRHIPAECETVNIVAPMYATANSESCSYFRQDKSVKFAQGITHLLDNVAHADAVILRDQLYTYFKRNTYYRIRNKERLIQPDEQEYIRKLFLKRGITEEPIYDEWIEGYKW